MFELAADRTALSQDLARRMIPTIRRIACGLAKRLPTHVRIEDLIGAGFQGLVAAHARFDPRRGDAFESYAELRIRGAMLDELRACDPLSRDRRALAKQTAAAARTASARLGREPMAEEIAAELGVPLEAYWARVSTVATVVTTSLDTDDEDEHGSMQVQDPHAEPADDRLERKQRETSVHRAIAELPPRLAQVIELHFAEGLTLKEIGVRLGVSESRSFQLVGDAVRRIREKCPDYAADAPPASTRRLERRGAAMAA
jgi:RNA polymerase sigma factor for flagellar operon FliA